MSIFRQRIPEYRGIGGRLGRHIHHDERSRDYAFNTAGLSIVSVRHPRRAPIFDQGDLGSCTGNAGLGTLGTDPFIATVFGQVAFIEPTAVGIYSDATRLDNVQGEYPPDDTGSSGLAVAKVLKNRGLIRGYQHTFSFTDALKALTVTPVMFGINWYDSFDRPDSNGFIKITRDAQVRGGHEVEADEIDVARRLVGFCNSWGPGFGLAGRFYLGFSDVERLLAEQGDVTVLTPLTPIPTPVPTPTPKPGPDQSDVNLWRACQEWAKAKGLAA